MISNSARTTIISSMGWIDRDALWVFDVRRGRAEQIPLGTGASYLSLHHSGSDHFAVAHHVDDGSRFQLTVHAFDDPGTPLARAVFSESEIHFDGGSAIWTNVPKLYVSYLRFRWNEYVLLKLLAEERRVEVQTFDWYDQTYDKMYQSVIGVLELPGEDFALISVQRSSQVIVHDLNTGKQRGIVKLGGLAGNPALKLHASGREIWALDYDTLVRVRRKDLRVTARRRVQSAFSGTQQFAGEFSFAPDENLCVVARPYSGDVVALDTSSLRKKQSAILAGQPLEVAAIGGGEIVARDWKTGQLQRGKLERRWFIR